MVADGANGTTSTKDREEETAERTGDSDAVRRAVKPPGSTGRSTVGGAVASGRSTTKKRTVTTKRAETWNGLERRLVVTSTVTVTAAVGAKVTVTVAVGEVTAVKRDANETTEGKGEEDEGAPRATNDAIAGESAVVTTAVASRTQSTRPTSSTCSRPSTGRS
jgi:hypothetical protein